MLIFRGLYSARSGSSAPELVRQAVALTIGNFDGVHLGHQALLNQLSEAAKSRGLPTAVLTFEPHPREFFMPQQAPARLTSMREKLEFFAKIGIDQVHVCRFNAHFAHMTAQDFMRAICQKLAAKFILVGDDFRFGSKRAGDFALMNKMSAEYGVTVQAMSSVLLNDERISSTTIRAALAAGNLPAANDFLGRAY
ncbi:MAG: bifunctional riboflavin kinase/FAD synthetase, partial [Candidatus Nitrotoga sp.]